MLLGVFVCVGAAGGRPWYATIDLGYTRFGYDRVCHTPCAASLVVLHYRVERP